VPAICATRSATITRTARMNTSRSYSPRTIRASFCSHCPVSSADVSSGERSMVMSATPFGVATSDFFSRLTYSRLSNVSMMAARVAGVPRPASFMASRSSSSSICFPAVSIASSRVASE
jgi:hypothetical protein